MKNDFFCPNPACPTHKEPFPPAGWYSPNGCYPTKAFGLVQRYKCKHCHRGFSLQTLSIDYFAKKQIDYQWILNMVSSCVNNRAIGRNLGVSHQCVANRINRLARQCIAFHTDKIADISLLENFAADGFESYCTSQFFPNNINLLVGEKSQFVYFFNYVLLRRKGRMTEKQKVKREELETKVTYPPKGLEKGFGEVLDTVEEFMGKRKISPVILQTDEKPDYRRAIQSHSVLQMEKSGDFVHKTTSSQAARDKKNPLFPVNYMDRQIRKDQSNHVRETVCFSRNVCNMLNRMMVYLHWHNYQKPYRIDKKEESKYQHAETAGLNRVEYEEEKKHLLKRRRFLGFSKQIKGFWETLWKRMIVTPLKGADEYLPVYALV